jgi:hypothetical protein
MTKFAVFNEIGLPTSFYAEDIHGSRTIDGAPNPDTMIPIEAVEITDDQWQELLGLRYRWDGEKTVEYTPPPQPEPVPSTISDRQFFQQLAVGGLITESEALAAVQTGTLPAALVAFIDQLPAEQQFPARMLLTGATSFERAHPLTDAFGSMYGMNGEQVDQLWRDAAKL